jgi:PIN domain nuclease of toxin-antitoxin system
VKVLLDAHTLVWWFSEPEKLSKRAASIITNSSNAVLVSAASAWELVIKVNLGKVDATSLVSDLSMHLAEEGFEEPPIAIPHATRAGSLPLHHRDPFNRLLVAQALELDVPILSADKSLDRYDIRRVW